MVAAKKENENGSERKEAWLRHAPDGRSRRFWEWPQRQAVTRHVVENRKGQIRHDAYVDDRSRLLRRRAPDVNIG